MAKDPVCGMDVAPETAKHTTQHEGQTYYFCAPGCKKAFETEPQKYLDPGHKAHM
ncbi:MAG: YHS domain-containing protein [Chloroflexi bacterium]|nr:YHS domain-containing protein [Chloroflexota bacterium]